VTGTIGGVALGDADASLADLAGAVEPVVGREPAPPKGIGTGRSFGPALF
jgi:hypothetical protein